MTARPLFLFVVGARPNFVKAAPVVRETLARDVADVEIVHTGQHYDRKMSDDFFRDLQMPEPTRYLRVGSGTHAEQTAHVMLRIEPLLAELRPRWTLVFGDVNSTLAAALTARKLDLPVAHVEAGLRSFDEGMPEEVNRRLTDAVSRLLFTTEASGNENLRREGVADDRIRFVGNTMVDSLLANRERSREAVRPLLEELGLDGDFAVATLHRPSNVDSVGHLRPLWSALADISKELPVVFPVHPRTGARLEEAGLTRGAHGVRVCEPLPYLRFLGLLDAARIVLTDSGGIQEETTALGVPCLTLRHNTERPVTLETGTNRLVGNDPADVVEAARQTLTADSRREARQPPLWDGRAAQRIVAELISCGSST